MGTDYKVRPIDRAPPQPYTQRMLQNLSPGAVICLALALVLLINGSLILAFGRGRGRSQIQLIQRAVGAARDPWKAEREAAGELHRQVEQLAQEAADRAVPAGADGVRSEPAPDDSPSQPEPEQ